MVSRTTSCVKTAIPILSKRRAKAEWEKCTKKSDFQWTTKAEAAFKQMKLIAELPTLTAPMEKEELIVYLAAAKEAVSVVLMMEREVKQMPIYFVSRVLQGPESLTKLQRNWCVQGHTRSGVISSVLMQQYLRTLQQRRRGTKLRRNQAELNTYHR
ncbi:reverse transcriptase domain-containing protein [Tanacetum coccineum]